MKTMTYLILPALALATPALALPGPQAQRSESRAERLAMVKPHFAMLDANHDGSVTKEEVLALRDRQAADRFDYRFKTMDGNQDGMITRNEFTGGSRGRTRGGFTRTAAMGGAAATPYFGTRMFSAADINKDGRMTEAEMTANVMAWFDRTDLDHDGVLTADERKTAREMKRASRAARGGQTG